MKSQTSEIVKHLKEKGTITSMEAFKLYGATRLGSIIHDLRKRGYEIETVMMEGTTRYGTATQYAKYVYRGEE